MTYAISSRSKNNWAITIKGGAPNSNAPVGSIALMPVSHYTADAVASDPELTKRYGKYLGDNALEVGYWIGRRSGVRDTCPKH